MQMAIWFRSGGAGDFTVNMLGRKDARYPYCDASPDLEVPNEEMDFSVLYAFVGCDGSEEFVVQKGLSALCLINKFGLSGERETVGPGMPLDPTSRFWTGKGPVRNASDVAAAADHFARLLKTGDWKEMSEYLLPVRRTSPDFIRNDDDVSDREFIETITNELGLIAGHCRWFVENRKAPVLISVQALV